MIENSSTSLRKGGPHCVDSGSNLGKLYFGRGTQLTVQPGEWTVFAPGKYYCKEIERGGE